MSGLIPSSLIEQMTAAGVLVTTCMRKARLQTATSGAATWVFSPPFASGVIPRVLALAEGNGTDLYNVQTIGTPSNTSVSILVNRTQQSVVALLGLTILSVPVSPGATWVHLFAVEP